MIRSSRLLLVGFWFAAPCCPLVSVNIPLHIWRGRGLRVTITNSTIVNSILSAGRTLRQHSLKEESCAGDIRPVP